MALFSHTDLFTVKVNMFLLFAHEGNDFASAQQLFELLWAQRWKKDSDQQRRGLRGARGGYRCHAAESPVGTNERLKPHPHHCLQADRFFSQEH